jgi:hypothetical protein
MRSDRPSERDTTIKIRGHAKRAFAGVPEQ